MIDFIFSVFDWITASEGNFLMTFIGCFVVFFLVLAFTAFNKARKEKEKWDSILFEQHRKMKDIKNLGEYNETL